MSKKIIVSFFIIISLMIINYKSVFANASSDFEYFVQNNISSFKETDNYNNAINSLQNYENLVVCSRYYFTFTGSEGDQITNRTYYTQFYIYGSNNLSYFEKNNYNAVVTPAPVMYLNIEFNHKTGAIKYKNYGEKTTKQSFQMQNDPDRKIVFTTKDINYYNSSNIYYPATNIYKKPYYELINKPIGTTELANIGEVPVYYRQDMYGWSNSYTSGMQIGYLYIDKNYKWDDIFMPALYITKANMNFSNKWYDREFLFFKEEETEQYIKYSISIENLFFTAPAYYNIYIQSVNKELSDDININFGLINKEKIPPTITITSGDNTFSGDVQDNTTIGDIQNTINNIFQKPNEEELKKEQEENINQIKEQITNQLENNKVFSALTTAEQGLIEMLEGEPGDFKISWDSVKFYDVNMIPAGEVNFSKIARENESIGYVKQTLNIILSGYLALNILNYIYNLILTTLGIDNPFIIEPTKENTTITETSVIKTKSGKTIKQTKKYRGDN